MSIIFQWKKCRINASEIITTAITNASPLRIIAMNTTAMIIRPLVTYHGHGLAWSRGLSKNDWVVDFWGWVGTWCSRKTIGGSQENDVQLPLSLTLWLRESPLIFPVFSFLLWGKVAWGRWFWMFFLDAQYTQGDKKNIMRGDEIDNG